MLEIVANVLCHNVLCHNVLSCRLRTNVGNALCRKVMTQ